MFLLELASGEEKPNNQNAPLRLGPSCPPHQDRKKPQEALKRLQRTKVAMADRGDDGLTPWCARVGGTTHEGTA